MIWTQALRRRASLAVQDRVAQIAELGLPAQQCQALLARHLSAGELVGHPGELTEHFGVIENASHTPTLPPAWRSTPWTAPTWRLTRIEDARPSHGDTGPTVTAILEDGPLRGRRIDTPVVEGRPPKTLDVAGHDGTTCRYCLADWAQTGPSAAYTFLYRV